MNFQPVMVTLFDFNNKLGWNISQEKIMKVAKKRPYSLSLCIDALVDTQKVEGAVGGAPRRATNYRKLATLPKANRARQESRAVKTPPRQLRARSKLGATS